MSNDLKLAGGREKDISHGLKRDDPAASMGVGRVVTPRPISTMQRVDGDTWRVPKLASREQLQERGHSLQPVARGVQEGGCRSGQRYRLAGGAPRVLHVGGRDLTQII